MGRKKTEILKITDKKPEGQEKRKVCGWVWREADPEREEGCGWLL